MSQQKLNGSQYANPSSSSSSDHRPRNDTLASSLIYANFSSLQIPAGTVGTQYLDFELGRSRGATQPTTVRENNNDNIERPMSPALSQSQYQQSNSNGYATIPEFLIKQDSPNAAQYNQYRCNQCSGVMKRPMTLQCGHNYCAACNTNGYCAQCKLPFNPQDSTMNQSLYNGAYSTVVVYCIRRNDGCLWEGTYNKLSQHLQTDCLKHLALYLSQDSALPDPGFQNRDPLEGQMASVITEIDGVIFGTTNFSGGAVAYDKQMFDICYRLYRDTTLLLLLSANKLVPKPYWVNILRAGLAIAENRIQQGNVAWGRGSWADISQDDPCWVLRKAFEAIKNVAVKKNFGLASYFRLKPDQQQQIFSSLDYDPYNFRSLAN